MGFFFKTNKKIYRGRSFSQLFGVCRLLGFFFCIKSYFVLKCIFLFGPEKDCAIPNSTISQFATTVSEKMLSKKLC